MELEEIVNRLEIWANGGKAGPVRMELHPTDRCNLNCIFCWRAAVKGKVFPEMTEKRLLKIPKEAFKLGVKEWVVSGGGEPLVRKQATIKVLKEIKKYKMWGLLTTNGTLMDEKVSRILVKIGWDQVQVSIDGPNAKINDHLRGVKGAFERATQNVKLLRKIRDKEKSSKPYIGFNTILNSLNYDKLDKMMELAKEVGSQLVYFEPLYPGYTKERLELNKKEEKKLKKYVKKALKKAKELQIDTNIKQFYETRLVEKQNLVENMLKEVEGLDGFIGSPCFRPWYLMGIKASGFAGCCSTFEIGEYINHKSLKDVWYGKLFNKLRNQMKQKKMQPYCAKCSVVVLMENRELRKMLMERWKKK